MTRFRECDLCAAEVERLGLDDDDEPGLRAWHRRWHK